MGKKTSKGSKTKGVNKTGMRSDLKGIIYITIGILLLVSIFSAAFSKSSAGILGNVLRKTLMTIMGAGVILFPFIIIYIGFRYIVYNKSGKFVSSKFYEIIGLVINTLVLFQNVTMPKMVNMDIGFIPVSYFYNLDSIFHGGIIAYIIDYPLYSLFGKVGSYILIIAMYFILTVLLLDISVKELIGAIAVSFNKNKSKMKKKTPKKDKKEGINVVTLEDDGETIIADPQVNINDFSKDDKDSNKGNIINIDFGEECEVVADESTEISSVYEEDPSIYSKSKGSRAKGKKVESENIKREVEDEIIINSCSKNKGIEYEFPKLDFLNENESIKNKKLDKKELLSNANKLQETLSSFGVNANVLQVTKGPSVTRYEIQPEVGVKVSKIVNLSDDIALNLASAGIRMEAPIPGKAAIGIEVPNKELTSVCVREVIESEEFINTKKNLAFCLGKDIGGKCIVGDLSKMPHVLVAGATGSGKSVCINTLICSLLYKYSPEEVKLLLIDPKVVELNVYNGIPHLLIPVVTDPKKASGALNWAVNEMTRRYNTFAENAVKNIAGYNELYDKGLVEEKMASIVIIIDELADLMMVCPKDVEDYIARLAQMARAAGMHLVIATQRPSVDVITGMIKANIPSRIAFAVSSQIDSRTIIDSAGAEKLLGKGDMLYYPSGAPKPIRIQGAFISETEVERVVEFIKNQSNEIEYKQEIIEEIDKGASKEANESGECDEILSDAIEFIIESGYASTSMLQRKYKIGYNRAARLIEEIEERGIISGRNGSKPRQVLVSKNDI